MAGCLAAEGSEYIRAEQGRGSFAITNLKPATESRGGVGILRLRVAIRFANGHAPLSMTGFSVSGNIV